MKDLELKIPMDEAITDFIDNRILIAIQKLNRDYSTKLFNENIERQKPFYEAGLKAGVKYPDAITNKLDPTQSGSYKTKLGLIEKDLEGAPEYVREDAISRLGAVEGEKQKSRLKFKCHCH